MIVLAVRASAPGAILRDDRTCEYALVVEAGAEPPREGDGGDGGEGEGDTGELLDVAVAADVGALLRVGAGAAGFFGDTSRFGWVRRERMHRRREEQS